MENLKFIEQLKKFQLILDLISKRINLDLEGIGNGKMEETIIGSYENSGILRWIEDELDDDPNYYPFSMKDFQNFKMFLFVKI